MVVDDDPLMRIHLKQMLIENGFDIAEAADGIEAVSVYQAFEPDMVFLKINISNKGGLAALKEIKEINPNAHVAMIVIEGQQALVMEALKIGAVDFVTKPFDQEEVLGTLQKILGLRWSGKIEQVAKRESRS